jgi:outer membrane protein assembly factor BamB
MRVKMIVLIGQPPLPAYNHTLPTVKNMIRIESYRNPLCGTVVLLTSLLCTATEIAQAAEPSSEHWGRFRGENGVASLERCDVPLPWKPTDVAWQVELPGTGNGSPVFYGDKVFLMAANPDTAERYLLAYQLQDGKQLWRKSIASEPHHLHARSSYASCTPCVNESAVFFCWATPQELTLAAFSHAGEELWKKDLGSYVSQHGLGASPALFGKTLILLNSQDAQELPEGVEPGESRVMAFDCETGNEKWSTPRTTTRTCYGVPTQFKDSSGVDALLFCNTGDGIFALNLETGAPLWNTKVFSKRCVSSPVIVGDMAFGTEGSGGGGNILFGVELSGDHNLKLKVDRSAPYVPTPVAKDDLLFLWGDAGIVSCIKLPSGDVMWSKRIGGNVSSSPVIAGDKLMGIAEDGTVTVLAASTGFNELGSVKLGSTCRATPALSEHFLLVRTDAHLMCIGKPE